MIELTDITKIYLGPSGRLEENVLALSNITLKVREGSIVAIMGESGSGKTTLLDILAGRTEPTTGKGIVLTTPLDVISSDESQTFWRRHVHYVHQNMRDNLQYDLTVRENYEMFTALSDCVDTEKLENSVLDLRIDDLMDTKVRHLSGGEKQLVCLALALAKETRLLILDEPTSSLDEVNKHSVIQKLTEMCRMNKITMLYTSHDPEVSQYSDVIFGINHGRFDRILKNTSREDVQQFVQGRYHELPVDSKGAIHLPQYVIDKLQIGDHVEIRLEEDHLKIFPVKEENR